MKALITTDYCSMCGTREGQLWETDAARLAALSDQPRIGDPTTAWTVCDECNEGLQNNGLPRPDTVWLLSQIRRANIDDQKAVLEWLLGKYQLRAVPAAKGRKASQ